MPIAVLILAAGASSRMEGDIKQLLPWGNSTLLENAIHQAKGVADRVYIVLGANAEKILASIAIHAEIMHNPNWQLGMGSSISTGVRHILEKENPEALLIMVADQPLIDATFLSQLNKVHVESQAKITATSYHNGAGVPAIFDKSLFAELKELQEDFGARRIIKSHKMLVKQIDPQGKEIDIDTKEKYLEISGKQYFKYD
ncbi:nucleotidyltransferase family protein [Flagellimonas sp. 2504JD4-2]